MPCMPVAPNARIGPFGEPVFPDATEDQRFDAMIQYRVEAEFDQVAYFYRQCYRDEKWMLVVDGRDDDGTPNLSVAPTKKLPDIGFRVLMVLPDKNRKKKRKQHTLVMVMSRSA